mmetsp:Transcript_5063/g.4560  ORF Transcript_5063/g.4560 Transcript_5063/m.4560 type:complete len:100 (-) Transcript_5063:1109-1408(-)
MTKNDPISKKICANTMFNINGNVSSILNTSLPNLLINLPEVTYCKNVDEAPNTEFSNCSYSRLDDFKVPYANKNERINENKIFRPTIILEMITNCTSEY